MTERISLPFETTDIKDQKLGNIEIIESAPLCAPAPPKVKYTIPPDIEVIGVNAPRYDCCVQKVIDEMGRYVGAHNMTFVLGNDNAPRDIIGYFPSYVMYFRSGTIAGTPKIILDSLNDHINYYHSLGLKVFYYIDDYLLNMNDRAPVGLMLNCDDVIVSTNALKDLITAEGVSRPIHVLKTHMDLPTFNMLEPVDTIRDSSKVNIFVSSQGRIGVRMLHDIVERMNQTPEKYKNVHFICLSHECAQVRSMINRYRAVKKTYLEWIPLDIYYRIAMTMDIIIAPGQVGDLDYMMGQELQEKWLNCKSAHKYTLAGASGLPCVASPMQDYVESIKDGENGFIAKDLDEWMTKLDALIFDADLRKKLGSAARKDVEDNWNIYNRTEELVSILRGKSVVPVPDMPSVSICQNPKVMTYIPVHNGMEFIKEGLDSVVSQSYPDQLVVVCDNASTDGTPEFVEKNYPQVELIRLKNYIEIGNPGYIMAIQKHPECDFSCQIGSDDKLVENYWETVIPYFREDPTIGFVRVGCYQFSEGNPDGSWWRPIPWNNPIDILIANKVFINSPVRLSALRSIEGKNMEGFTGGFDINCFFSDWDQWIQLVLIGWKWATCKKPMFWYRRHAKSWSLNYDTSVEGPAYTYMRNKWMPYLLKYGIKESTMATKEMVELVRKSSKYAAEDIK